MQCPPTPMLGRNFIKPYGLVSAAESVSKVGMPRAFAICANSLTSAIFTWRKVFSKSLAASATSGDETSMISVAIVLYNSLAFFVASSVRPPIRRGVLVMSQLSLAGSTLSGADAYRYWLPRMGAITFRRVPGNDVDSLMIRVFSFKCGLIELQADSI